MTSVRVLKLFFLLLAVLTANVNSKETISLTVIDAYATTAPWVRVFVDEFIPAVDKRLRKTNNYSINWNKAFGGSIAKTGGVFDALQHDLADIGLVTTPFHGDKLPFYNLSYVTPFVSSDNELIVGAINTLTDKYPQVKQVWEDHNQVALTAAGSVDTYAIFLIDKPTSLKDLDGKRIGGIGLNLRYLDGLNSTKVASALNDWYLGMDTGLLQGVVAWASAAVSYKLYEVAPYMLEAKMSTTTSTVVSINRKTYLRLPAEVREAVQLAAIDYRNALAADTTLQATKSRAEYVRQGGEIIHVTPQQRKEWAMALPNLAREWADAMEQSGYPGHTILRDYMDLMRAKEENIMRDWDKE